MTTPSGPAPSFDGGRGSSAIAVRAVPWPEISAGDDLGRLLATTADLADGDVAVVTSKVVSKAEGRVRSGDRATAVAEESERVLARRESTVIAETRQGLVMAAAGVDASNTPPGTVVLLPLDSDASARRLREQVYAASGRNVAVVVSDTLGRAWRNGQTDLAIGCAGLHAMVELGGARDPHGNELRVTAPAVADEIASAADLVKGKLSGQPVAVVSGMGAAVLPPGCHGGGAARLVRGRGDDLFGLGAREAVVAAALRDDPVALDHFPTLGGPADAIPWSRLVSTHPAVQVAVTESTAQPSALEWSLTVQVQEDAPPDALIHAGRLVERARVIAAAYRLTVQDTAHPSTVDRPSGGRRAIASLRFRAP